MVNMRAESGDAVISAHEISDLRLCSAVNLGGASGSQISGGWGTEAPAIIQHNDKGDRVITAVCLLLDSLNSFLILPVYKGQLYTHRHSNNAKVGSPSLLCSHWVFRLKPPRPCDQLSSMTGEGQRCEKGQNPDIILKHTHFATHDPHCKTPVRQVLENVRVIISLCQSTQRL